MDDSRPSELRATMQLVRSGNQLDDEQVAELEQIVQKEPSDLDSRIQLLAAYMQRKFTSDTAKVARIRHINWVIDNHPEHPVAGLPVARMEGEGREASYTDTKERWLKQVELRSDNVAVLLNASKFFLHSDKELSEKCLLTAKCIEPGNGKLDKQLAFLYHIWGPEYSEKALTATEAAILLAANPEEAFSINSDLPQRAFAAGDFEKALLASQRLLEMALDFKVHWNYGNAIQNAHKTLGLIALRNNDLEQAEHHLLQSAMDAASPQTSSFGPDLTLAKELVARGRTQSVLEYLDLCKAFCTSTHTRLIEMRVRIDLELPHDKPPIDAEKFHSACLEMELKQLQVEPSSRAKSSILEAIEKTEGHIRFWSDLSESAGKSDKKSRKRQVKELQSHLKKLQSMLDEHEKGS